MLKFAQVAMVDILRCEHCEFWDSVDHACYCGKSQYVGRIVNRSNYCGNFALSPDSSAALATMLCAADTALGEIDNAVIGYLEGGPYEGGQEGAELAHKIKQTYEAWGRAVIDVLAKFKEDPSTWIEVSNLDTPNALCDMGESDREMGWECMRKTGLVDTCDDCPFVKKVEVDDGQGN